MSKQTEWQMLNKYYGNYEMSVMFRDFSGYEAVRENSTYQQIFNELEKLSHE